MTIFQRLTAGYLLIIFMVFSFGSFSAYQLNRLTRITHLAAGADSEVIKTAESLSTRLQIILALEKKYWISDDEDFYRLFVKRLNEFEQELISLTPLLEGDASAQHLARMLELTRRYLNMAQSIEKQGLKEPTQTYRHERDVIEHSMPVLLDQIRQSGNDLRHERILQSQNISARMLWITIAFAAGCIIAGLTVSLRTTRSIVHPVLELQKKTREIAEGRFVTIQGLKAPPEISDLARDFNTMSDRLNELDMLKEDFISHISHALRTPLTSIWEASGMLNSGTFETDVESRYQLLSIIRDECRRLIESVNRILDLSRMEAGMMDYRFERVDLNQLIRSTIHTLSPIARSKQIRMSFEAGKDLPPVQADSEKLGQLIENLIGNALKFTDHDGCVDLKADCPNDANRRVQISISDTGCGIEKEYLDHIFEKFRRIEKGKNATRGTGLGLAIAKHIVAAHGGHLWVESEKGHGSTFYFSLPCVS
jgi:two-component system, NtrC family, sensor histidine kinase GlrK